MEALKDRFGQEVKLGTNVISCYNPHSSSIDILTVRKITKKMVVLRMKKYGGERRIYHNNVPYELIVVPKQWENKIDP